MMLTRTGLPEQVEVAVVTKMVTVRHTGALLPAAAVAALNQARLDASLQAPRQQTKITGSWLTPWRGKHSSPNLCLNFKFFHLLDFQTPSQTLDQGCPHDMLPQGHFVPFLVKHALLAGWVLCNVLN